MNDMNTSNTAAPSTATAIIGAIGPVGGTRRFLWWAVAGLAGVMAVTGSAGAAMNAETLVGRIASVVIMTTIPAVLVLFVLGLAVVVPRFAKIDPEGTASNIAGVIAAPAMFAFGTCVAALIMVGHKMADLGVHGGFSPATATAFPFIIAVTFVAFAVAAVAGALLDALGVGVPL